MAKTQISIEEHERLEKQRRQREASAQRNYQIWKDILIHPDYGRIANWMGTGDSWWIGASSEAPAGSYSIEVHWHREKVWPVFRGKWKHHKDATELVRSIKEKIRTAQSYAKSKTDVDQIMLQLVEGARVWQWNKKLEEDPMTGWRLLDRFGTDRGIEDLTPLVWRPVSEKPVEEKLPPPSPE